jgi:hypothetical protein
MHPLTLLLLPLAAAQSTTTPQLEIFNKPSSGYTYCTPIPSSRLTPGHDNHITYNHSIPFLPRPLNMPALSTTPTSS